MSGHLKCFECHRKFKKLHPDPRLIPVEIGDCLCVECTEAAYLERIEELQEELEAFKNKEM